MENDPRPSSAGDKGYLPTLDGWRAIAVALVVIFHGLGLNGSSDLWAHQGGLGVMIFFVISGFLICTRLLREIRESGRVSFRAFIIRRMFRIFPAAAVYLLVLSALGLFGLVLLDWSGVAASALCSRNYWGKGWYTDHFWSLAVEEHFYAVFPLFLAVVRPRAAAWCLPFVALAVVTWRAVLIHYGSGGSLYFHTDTRADSLVWGTWVAVVTSGGRVRLPELLPKAAGFLLSGTAVTLICLVAEVKNFNTVMDWLSAASTSVNLRYSIKPMLIAALIAITVKTPRLWLCRVLEWSWVRWIGRLSYSIYLYQELFLAPRVAEAYPRLGGLQGWPIGLLGTLGCAIASYYLVEKPFIALGHRLVARQRGRLLPQAERALPQDDTSPAHIPASVADIQPALSGYRSA